MKFLFKFTGQRLFPHYSGAADPVTVKGSKFWGYDNFSLFLVAWL